MNILNEIKELEAKLEALKSIQEKEKEDPIDIEAKVAPEGNVEEGKPESIPVRCKITGYVTNDGGPNLQIDGDLPSAIYLVDYAKKYLDLLIESNIRTRMEESKHPVQGSVMDE
jgi:hypothetical protein